jgi:hypothetical protein
MSLRPMERVVCAGCDVEMSAPVGNTDPCPHCGGELRPVPPLHQRLVNIDLSVYGPEPDDGQQKLF